MLVLSRKLNESIVINDNIVITVLGVDGDKVKLGISAPKEIEILRHELWQAVREQDRIAEDLASRETADAFEELRKLLTTESLTEEPDTST